MQSIKLLCPKCGSNQIIYNGYNGSAKQRYKYKNYGKQFVENPGRSKVSREKKGVIKRLLTERITLAGIARVVKISISWLQRFANHVYQTVPKVIPFIKRKVRLVFEYDEM